jgi:hypothetical protein
MQRPRLPSLCDVFEQFEERYVVALALPNSSFFTTQHASSRGQDFVQYYNSRTMLDLKNLSTSTGKEKKMQGYVSRFVHVFMAMVEGTLHMQCCMCIRPVGATTISILSATHRINVHCLTRVLHHLCARACLM